MRRLFDWLLGGGSARSRKGRKARRRARAAELAPALEVRTLEERRVFHAGAVAPLPGVATTPTPPPAPTTTVSLDANQNLYVHDSTTGGQNDQLTLRFDAEHQGYLLSDATQLLETDIAGATGSGTHEIFIPFAAVAGSKLIFDTAGGDDSLTVDLSNAPAGQTIVFDGGLGQNDTLKLVGGNIATANYLLADGSSQINLLSPLGSTTLELTGVEPIYDGLAVGNRQFTTSTTSSGSSWTLAGNSQASGQISLLSSLGTSVVFAAPESMLSVDAGLGSSLQIVGQFDLAGDLAVRADSIDVSGTLTAHGGTIDLAAASALTVSAGGLISNPTGVVHLDAGAEGTLEFAGQIDVSGQRTGQVGGTVHLLGRQVALIDHARIDASGRAGGGTVLIGGDFQGNNDQIRNATNTWVGEDVAITANALDQGNGGKIIVWANDTALVFGSGNLQARGGASGGNGGLIETSGKRYLYVEGAPDAGTVSGAVGMWLLDPLNVSIVSSDPVPLGLLVGSNPATFTPVAGNTEILASTIAAALVTSDVTITTGSTGTEDGDITVSAAIGVIFGVAGTNTLTLDAADDIFVNASITCSALGAINVVLDAGGDVFVSDNIATSGGSFEVIAGANVNVNSSVNTGGGRFEIDADGAVNINASISTGGGAAEIDADGNVSILANINAGSGNAQMLSGGDIGFFDNVSITAGSAELNAAGLILSGDATVDIDTSSANGAIQLTGGSGIGTSSDPVRVSAGTGNVTLTTSTAAGHIYLRSPNSLDLGQVTTAAGSDQIVDIRTTSNGADINVVADSTTTNDSWTLVANDDINFTGGSTITASTVSLSAGDNITSNPSTSDADLVVSTSLTLSADQIGESSNRLVIQPGSTAAISLSANEVGGMFVELKGGAVQTSNLTLDASNSGTTVDLLVSGGNLTFDSITGLAGVKDDNLAFSTTGSTSSIGHAIVFDANIVLEGANVKLNSAGLIQAGSGNSGVNTEPSDGNITLIAATGIGTAANPLMTNLGSGDLYVDAAAGEIALSIPTGNFSFSQIKEFKSGGIGVTVTLQVALGDISVNDVSGVGNSPAAATIDDDHLRLIALAGSIEFSAANALLVGSADLQAAGDILNLAGANDINLSAAGDIDFVADNIGMSSDPLLIRSTSGVVNLDNSTAAGEIGISSDQAIRIGAVLTDGTNADQLIRFTTTGAGRTLTFTQSIASNDQWTLASGGDLVLADGVTIQAKLFDPILAGGKVLGGALTGTAAHFDSSASNSDIEIIAGGIGTPDQFLVLNAGTGLLDLTATTYDLCVAVATGDLTASRFTNDEIIAPTAGVTIGLGTRNGSIDFLNDLPTVAGVPLNTLQANGLSLEARGTAGNIDLGGQSLVFTSVTIRADGSITGFSFGTAIDTSAAGGDITLESYGAIGTSGSPLFVDSGTGAVSVTTTGPNGDIFLRSNGALDLGQFNAADNTQTQTISVYALGTLTISSPSVLANDDLVLTSQLGNIEFVGSGSVKANSVTLRCDNGDIISGSAIADVEIAADGLFRVILSDSIGASGNPLAVQANGGMFNLASYGSIYLAVPTGNLSTSQFLNLSAAGQKTVELTTQNGSLTIDETLFSISDDKVVLKAEGVGNDITFETGKTLFARTAELTAAGSIIGGAGNSGTDTFDIATIAYNGAITLTALGGSIGDAANDLRVYAGFGAVSAETTNSAGDIYLASEDNLQLGTIVSGASAHLTADGFIFSGSSPVDIDTTANDGEIEIVGTKLGSEFAPLVLDRGAGDLRLTATSNEIWVEIAQGNLNTSDIATLSAAPGAKISLNVLNGSLTLDDLAGFVGTANNQMILAAGGDIAFSGLTTLVAISANLNAGGSITSGDAAIDIDTSLANGTIQLTAADSIGPATATPQPANPLVVSAAGAQVSATTSSPGGHIHLLSVGVLNLGAVSTGAGVQTVDLQTTGPLDDINLRVDSLTGDDWSIVSGRNINFFSGVTLTANSATLNAGGAIHGGGGGNVDIDTSAAGGAISLTAAGNIGDNSSLPLIVKGAGGDVSLDTSTGLGNIFLRSTSSLDLAEVTTALGTQTVDIRADGGLNQIRLLEAYADADDWTLVAGGDLTFVHDANLSARSAVLVAISGNILGGTVAVDYDVATTAELSVQGQQIGTTTNRLLATPGATLSLYAASAAGMFVDIGGGDFATSRLGLFAPAMGTVIDLRTTDGAFAIDVSLNTADDLLTLATQGIDKDISFLGNTTLVAQSVTLEATGDIVSGDAVVDILAVLDIRLLGGSIGTGPSGMPPDNPLAIQFGGSLAAEATSGDLWLLLPLGGLNTSQITSLKTPGHTAVVSLEALGDVMVSTTGGFSTLIDDHLRVVSQAGAVQFTNQTLAAGSLEIRAFTNIESFVSGAVLESAGTIDLVAGSGLGTGNIGTATGPIFLRAGGLVSLDNSMGDGGIHLTTDGDLSLGSVTTNSTIFGQPLEIEAIGSDSSLTLTTSISGNDIWTLKAGESVRLQAGVILTASSVALTAGSSIEGTPTSLIDTSFENGTISLIAGGDIGAVGDPLTIQAGFGAVFARTIDVGSDIHLAATGPLVLGSVVSAGSVHLQATGALLSAGGVVDIDTAAAGGEIELIAASIGGSTAPLRFDNRGGDLRLTATAGDIAIQIAAGTPSTTEGDLLASQIKLLSAAGDGVVISLATTDGSIYLDDLGGVQSNTLNDTLILSAGGAGSSIVQDGAGPLVANQIQLLAQNAIGQAGAPVEVSTPALITVSPGDQHLAAFASLNYGSPVINLAVSDGTIYLDRGLFTLNGSVIPFTFTPDLSILPAVEVTPTVELQGQGTIVGSLHVTNTAILDPGLADEETGIIEIVGATRFDIGALIFFDINPPYLLPGRDYDQLRVFGPIDLGGNTASSIDGATLKLRGAEQLQVTINDLVLIDNQSPLPVQGRFLGGGESSIVERRAGIDRVLIGISFRGNLLYNGGDGNDVVISEVSLAPPINRSGYRLPQFRIPLVARAVAAPEEEPIQPLTTPVEPPFLEAEVDNLQVRKIEVRLVLPLDDQGNVREEKVLELEAAWLKNLSSLFRKLPDDRYRIYLILEGGEARRVMDVIVKGGRPFEPEEARPAITPAPLPQSPAGSDGEDQNQIPELELPPVEATPSLELNAPGEQSSTPPELPGGHATRLFLGAAAAAGLIAARRSNDDWEQEIDQAAEELATRPTSTTRRWWRFDRSATAEANR